MVVDAPPRKKQRNGDENNVAIKTANGSQGN
jgi:hypothetical protein